MKVFICDSHYKHVAYYLSQARQMGYTPYEEDSGYFVDVLPFSQVWRSENSNLFGDRVLEFTFKDNALVSAVQIL